MIEARATVERIDRKFAWVRPDTVGGCGRCSEPGGCGAAHLTDILGTRRKVFALPNDIGVRPGDRVTITIQEGAPLRAALLSYGLGTVCAVAGAGMGAMLWPGDAGAGWGAIAGLCCAAALNRLLPRSRRWRTGLSMGLTTSDRACTRTAQPGTE